MTAGIFFMCLYFVQMRTAPKSPRYKLNITLSLGCNGGNAWPASQDFITGTWSLACAWDAPLPVALYGDSTRCRFFLSALHQLPHRRGKGHLC